jgi:2'-5' RNA ligase
VKEPAARSRIFLAVFPPPEVQTAAYSVIESLREANDGISWVKRENLHYTLHFIGEVGDDGARRVSDAADEAASKHAAFDAELGSAGAFPNARRPRVLWIGLSTGGPELEAVARDLDAALARRGFSKPDHPFRAHLTIGRVRDAREDWTARLAGAAPGLAARFRVERVAVVRSQLSPKGSIYTVRSEGLLRA